MQEERYGFRDQAYSAWHRRLSTRRFIGIEKAQLLSMIDLDACLYVEYDNGTKEPLALIETARDVGQAHKSATVTATLARLAKIPAFCCLYRVAECRNPADARWPDIAEFRVRRLYPAPDPTWRKISPRDWATALLAMRAYSCWRLDEAQAQADWAGFGRGDWPRTLQNNAAQQLELLNA